MKKTMKPDNAKRKTDILLNALYPKQCVCCSALIEPEEELCDNCIRNIERVDSLKRCLKCGLEKKECSCRLYVFHFEGCVAPFYNDGLAKRGLYNYKLNSRRHYGMFFAREMAKTVLSEYNGIAFDAVCFVPSSVKSLGTKGFNHSRELARITADLLGLPLIENVLVRKNIFFAQHKQSRKTRFSAVRKIYGYKEEESFKVKNKTVLLVDDIKTTGATLDECARQLLFAGACKVYCVTAVVNPYKKAENENKTKQHKPKNVLQKFGNNLG